jgi:hypothetical protein
VLLGAEADEVAQVVIEGIAVPVVYVVPIGYRSMRGFPDLAMKNLNALLAIRNTGDEVDP